ncbi:MAG: glycosyltransferase family 39 protein [Chromatiales bacterium]|nr:glycosyltransferase family 39 protein [Chromatiales bacterium]
MRLPTSRWGSDVALWWLIALAALARLASLGLYPLMDKTEARYAEIARKMVQTGDWVTPWFDHGVPFWGKPPLSFWMTAASFRVMGFSEFAARLPHWLGACAIAWLVWGWLARRSRREAVIALVLTTTSAAFLVAAGAVMTDMALAVGTTMALRGFWLGLHGDPAGRLREQAVFFAGLAIGLLAKGPIAAVLVGVPLAVWTLYSGKLGLVVREIRWVTGTLLVAMLVVPWYVLAEVRTPGFLEYFVVGEHWHRFVTPGWSGDLYGKAHAFPRGSIWPFAIAACLPWSVLVPAAALRWRRTALPIPVADRPLKLYLLLWALTPCVFFSLAGNILWTYVLPGLPALAILASLWLAHLPRREPVNRLLAGGVASMVLGIGTAVVAINVGGWADKASTRDLVADYDRHREDGQALVFLGSRPASAAFYSRGRAEQVCCADELAARLAHGVVYVAMKDGAFNQLPAEVVRRLQSVSRRGSYALYRAS